MNKAKILRGLSTVAKTLSVFVGFNQIPFINPEWAIVIFMLASTIKDGAMTLGDFLDDGKMNKSFDPQAKLPGILMIGILAPLVALGVGCAQFTHTDADGVKTRLTLFFQKAAVDGLKASPKTGLTVNKAETSGDAELIRAIAEGAAAGAIKGAIPIPK